MSKLITVVFKAMRVVDDSEWAAIHDFADDGRRRGWTVEVVLEKKADTMQTRREWDADRRREAREGQEAMAEGAAR